MPFEPVGGLNLAHISCAALLMISSPGGDPGYKEVHPAMEAKEVLKLLRR